MLTKLTIVAGCFAAGICATWGYMLWTDSLVTEQRVPDQVLLVDEVSESPFYSIRNGDVYCKETKLSSHGSSFKVVTDGFPFSDHYASDEENVYKNCEVVVGVDPTTFKVIVVHYAANISMDHQHLFLNGKNAGPAVTDISLDWGSDPYYGDSTRGHSGSEYLARIDFNKVVILDFASATITELPEVNATELRPVFGPLERPVYFKDSKTVLCANNGHITAVDGADPATFRAATADEYSRGGNIDGYDKNHAYSACTVAN